VFVSAPAVRFRAREARPPASFRAGKGPQVRPQFSANFRHRQKRLAGRVASLYISGRRGEKGTIRDSQAPLPAPFRKGADFRLIARVKRYFYEVLSTSC